MKLEENVREVLLTKEEIDVRIAELGKALHEDYKDKDNIILIGLLKGCVYFFTDLSQAMDLPVQIDFMVASSYGDGSCSCGKVNIKLDCKESLEGCNVILIDDIIDSGITLQCICELLAKRKPESIKTVVLCDKKGRREVDFDADYVGFVIPNEFVVGYGLDFAGDYRNLPYIGVLDPSAYEGKC